LPFDGGDMSDGDQFFSVAQKDMRGRAWNGNKKQREGTKRKKKSGEKGKKTIRTKEKYWQD
jgi:hypothetical protein